MSVVSFAAGFPLLSHLNLLGQRIEVGQQDIGKVPHEFDLFGAIKIAIIVVGGKVSVIQHDRNPICKSTRKITVIFEPLKFLPKRSALTIVWKQWCDATINSLSIADCSLSPETGKSGFFSTGKGFLDVFGQMLGCFGLGWFGQIPIKTYAGTVVAESHVVYQACVLRQSEVFWIAHITMNTEKKSHEAATPLAFPHTFMCNIAWLGPVFGVLRKLKGKNFKGRISGLTVRACYGH